MNEVSMNSTHVAAYSAPHDEGPSFGSDLESALAAAVLRLEEEAQSRRDLSRGERRRALESKHQAIQDARASARSKKIGRIVGSSLQLAASAITAIGGTAASEGSGASWAKGAAGLVEEGGKIASAQLEHRSTCEALDAEAKRAGAEGINGVAGDHASAREDAERAVERARNLLARVIDGAHAQKMAMLRG
jgi:hypothetical protein